MDCKIAEQSDALDNEFYNNYMQLNFYNRKIINTLVSDLLKLQGNYFEDKDMDAR